MRKNWEDIVTSAKVTSHKEVIIVASVKSIFSLPFDEIIMHVSRCVLKMDHHCPWIGGCVGYFNQGNFIRFIIHVDWTCFMLMISLGSHLITVLSTIDQEWREFGHSVSVLPIAEIILLCFTIIIDAVVLISVGILSLYQIFYICTNTSTIESWEQDRVRSYARRNNLPRVRYPYDLGMLKNIKSVLGENPWSWLWPQDATGNGIDYETRPGLSDEEYIWPPKWYLELKGMSIADTYSDSDNNDDDDVPLEVIANHSRIRRGSEGYEVRGISYSEREAMLHERKDS